jgi:hypothetical protein
MYTNNFKFSANRGKIEEKVEIRKNALENKDEWNSN